MSELTRPGSGTELKQSAEREAGGRMNEPVPLGTAFDPFNRNRAIVISLFALALAGLSFHGGLDNLAAAKIGELVKQNLGLLGIATAIDAVVSLVGQFVQLIDPINDGVERLTDVLLFATGSLILQDVLLTITSGAVFRWGFLAIAATAAACVLLAQSNGVRTAFASSFGVSEFALARFQDLLITTFIVATVVRFIVPVFATASLLVSQALVAPELRQQTEALEQHQKSLSEAGAQISQTLDEATEEQGSPPHDETEGSAPGGDAKPTSSPSAQPELPPEEELKALREQRGQLERTLASLESERQRRIDGISERKSSIWKDWMAKFGGDSDETLAQANARVEHTQSEIARKESEAACIDRPTAEHDCEPYLAEHERQALGELKVQLESEIKAQRERHQSLREARESAEAKAADEAKDETGQRDKGVGAVPSLPRKSSDEEGQPAGEEIGREVAEAGPGDEAEGKTGWRDRVAGAMPRLLRKPSDEEEQPAGEEIGREVAEADPGDEAEGKTGWRDKVIRAVPRMLRFSGKEEQMTVEEIDRKVAEASTLEKQRASELACVDRRIAGEHCDAPAVDDHVQSALDRVRERLASDLQPLRTELASRQGERERLVELAALEAERGQIESEIEKHKTLLERNGDEAECAEQRAAGKECGGPFERMGRAVTKLSATMEPAQRAFSSVTEGVRALSRKGRVVWDKVKFVAGNADVIVRHLVLLMILLAIENIVLPIIFLAIALKASVPITSGLVKLSTSINKDTRKALSAMDRALPSRGSRPLTHDGPPARDMADA